MQAGTKKFIKKTARIIGYILVSVLALLLVVIAVIQIPAVQKKITQRAVVFLEDKIGTEVRLQSLYLAFPKNIVLKGLYMEDQAGDTLLHAGRLDIDTDLWALLRNEIQLNKVTLENSAAHIRRHKGDTIFNYTYILNAFAGDSTATPDTLEQKGWTFVLKKVGLHNIRGDYRDALTGNDLAIDIGEFVLSLDVFDLSRYRFGVEDITLTNTKASLIQSKRPEVTVEVAEQSTDTMQLDLNFDRIKMENVTASYSQEALGQLIRLNVGAFHVNANHVDLKKRMIDLKETTLSNTFLSYQQFKGHQLPTGDPANAPTMDDDQSASSQSTDDSSTGQSRPVRALDWDIRLHKLDLAGNAVQYYDFNQPHDRDAVDPDHLWITNLQLSATDLVMNGTEILANITELAFQEKSGFVVKKFKTSVAINNDSTRVKDFLLETGNSRLTLIAGAEYESIAAVRRDISNANVTLDVTSSYLGFSDLLFFQPALIDSTPLNIPAASRIMIDASITGRVNDMTLHHLRARAFEDTQLRVSGKIMELSSPSSLRVDLALDKFFTTSRDVNALLPDTLLPDSMAIPEWLNVSGRFKGTPKQSDLQATFTTNIGAVEASGDINLDSTSATRGIHGKVAVNEFDLGALLMQPETIGKLNLLASINSEGLTMKEMRGDLDAVVKSFGYKGYEYKNFTVQAAMADDVLNGKARMQDLNLDFNLVGDINFQEDVPKYNFTLDLRNIDLKALQLSERPIKARGTLDVNMATADMRVLNGSLGIRKVAVFNGDALYAVDSLLFASIDQEGRSEIKIDSDVVNGRFEGTINVFTMPAVLREYFNTYYSLHDSVEQSYEPPQRFTFGLKVLKTELLTEILIPQLESFTPGEIKGTFDSEAKQLDLRFDISAIHYANIGVKSLVFSTNSDAEMLHFNLFADRIKIDSLTVDGLEFNGSVGHDSIKTNVIILDSLDLYKYVIAGTFFSRENDFEFRLDPGGVRLNYHQWQVPETNLVRFGGERIVIENMKLTNGREKIIIESKEDPGAPLFVGFRELNLEYLTSMVSLEKPVSGLLHGDINIYRGDSLSRFTSDIKINDLAFSEVPWGDVALSVEQKVTDEFDIHFLLKGERNDIRAEGFYAVGDNPIIDLDADIARFDLSALQPLLASQAQDLKGKLSGNIRVGGTPGDPDVGGNISFSNASFFSTYLKTAFTIGNETITLNDRGVNFNSFELTDENKHTATLDGLMATTNYRKFDFRLSLKTDQFQLLNTTEKDNDLFYGKVNITANARITGTSINPVVDTEVRLSPGNHLTYIVPETQASVLEQQGIVRFVDKTFKQDPFMKRIQPELKDTVKSTFKGIDLTAKIELSDQESLSIVIDPTTEDQLTIKGNSTLTLTMDQTGDLQLSGRYEISEGTYNLSFYKFVKREFQIEKGSTITWMGDPLNAEMDIRAIFEVETAPIDLLSHQFTGAENMDLYKQRLPFLVYLNITGQLLTPEIAFRLDMPIDERNVLSGNVYARIQDINTRESDLNKQVFALLILKRFISDNPFENQAGAGFEGTARTSVSKILTEQLNKLSENIKGVELSFDVKSYEDYSAGSGHGQTELQLGLSKSFMNDRLVVKLSGNVDIEGENTNREVTDYIGDLALEYLLTDDGRFRITGFRNSNYDMIDGELTETGAGLIYIKDYNTLAELFKANVKRK